MPPNSSSSLFPDKMTRDFGLTPEAIFILKSAMSDEISFVFCLKCTIWQSIRVFIVFRRMAMMKTPVNKMAKAIALIPTEIKCNAHVVMKLSARAEIFIISRIGFIVLVKVEKGEK